MEMIKKIRALEAENRELRAEIDRLKAERLKSKPVSVGSREDRLIPIKDAVYYVTESDLRELALARAWGAPY